MLLVSFWMTQRLTREINELERQAMEKQTRLSQYQKYAGILGGSTILHLGNISGLSAELLPRASLFAQYSDQASSMSAMQNLQTMKMMGRVPYTGDPATQYQIEMSAFANFKNEALKALKQQESMILNEKEKEIQLELNHIEQQLNIKRQQLETYKNMAKEESKKAVPTFGM